VYKYNVENENYGFFKYKIAGDTKHCILKVKNASGKQLENFNLLFYLKNICFDAGKAANG